MDTVQASVQYSGNCCICDSTGHSLQRCLATLKIASPSSTSYSERLILRDSCLKHGKHACANRVSAFSRNRQVNCRRNASESGRFRYCNREHNSASPGNYAGTTFAANHVGASIQPARQTLGAPSRAAVAALSAIRYRPTFAGCTNPSTRQQDAPRVQPTSTPWRFEDSNASSLALSTEQHHVCVDTVDTSTLVTQTEYKNAMSPSTLYLRPCCIGWN